MKQLSTFILLLLILSLPTAGAEGAFRPVPRQPDADNVIQPESLETERAAVWSAYMEAALSGTQLQHETTESAMSYGDVTMRYVLYTVGDKPENGYPLYIAMHGGGSGDTPYFNDEQWAAMEDYYRDELQCGVYVAVRGVRDTWDTHFNPESYPLYDRLIRYLILTAEVDPNRVYLEGANVKHFFT